MSERVQTFLGEVLPTRQTRFQRNPAQLAYAQSVSSALEGGLGRFHFIEGDTGIGKSLAYLLNVAEWVAERRPGERKGVIATFSRALQRQLLSDENLGLVGDFLDWAGLRRVQARVRMGVENYVSPERLAWALEADALEQVLHDQGRPQPHRDLARWALTSEGCLLDLDEGDLPAGLNPSEISLRQGDKVPERLKEFFDGAKACDLMVINSALLVADLTRKGVLTGMGDARTCLVIDEAEHFPEVAANMLSHRLSFGKTERLARDLGYKATAQRWRAIVRDTADPKSSGTAQEVPGRAREQILSGLRSIVQTRARREPQTSADLEWQSIRETARYLMARLRLNDDSLVAYYSEVWGLPSLVRANDTGGSCLRVGADTRMTLLTSATLSDLTDSGQKPSFRYMLGKLLINERDPAVGLQRRHTASNFGRLRFSVPAALPKPLRQGRGGDYELVLAFARGAVERILEGTGGRVLVLCSSYSDVAALDRAWPDSERSRLVTHPPGAVLNRVAQGLGASAVLLTPAGWEGLSPERSQGAFWSRVVILRNPTPALNPVERMMLVRRFMSVFGCGRSLAETRADKALFSQLRTKTAHKIRQGIGRAIRHPDDECEITFLDPRFPSPEDVTAKGGQNLGLAAAIPERFLGDYAAIAQPTQVVL